tara:strand:- start:615 stop:1442 length:828 start_codon:yes stop_codon:yes gene_type:complete
MKNKIYDCTTFYQGNLLFETRYKILKDYVDYFVVCEANKDHVGGKKPFNFNKSFLKKYSKKLIYIKVNNLPNIRLKGKKDYGILKIQMENIFRGIKNANDNDLIIFSDEDEIPNPKSIKNFKKEKFKFGIFLQNMYYFKLNIQNFDEGKGNWPGSRICKKKYLKSFFKLRLLKTKNIDYPFWRFDKEKNIQLIKKGGWHFTYLMSPKNISKKIKSMSHTEFNKKKFTNIKNIEKKISNLKDPFDRNFNLKKVSIDRSYPSYIRNNLNLFKKWILK